MTAHLGRVRGALPSALLIIVIAAAMIVFNGGISVGLSNHAGLLPVVRRILNSNYLPSDFGISVRFYHHRVFAYLVAGFSAVLGEDNALIALAAIGMTLLSASLFAVCRALNLDRMGFVVAGSIVATRLAWSGWGLEENNFAGNADIMPTTFAHAFLLFATASMIKGHYRFTGLFAGLVLLFHLQIGLIFVAVLVPFVLPRLKTIKPPSSAITLLLFVVAASVAIMHLFQMLRSGLAGSSFNLDYINFRHPHHFQLISAPAAVWVAIHLGVQISVYYWLRSRNAPEARGVGILAAMSTTIALLSLVHFWDYYILQNGLISKIQLVRLSPLITVFGPISLVTGTTVWQRERFKGRASLLRPATAVLVAIVALWTACYLILWPSAYRFGISRYAEQKTAWVDVCLWIKNNGPAGVSYLTPPDKGGFTYLSNRSTIVEFKINPDGALYLPEWYERLRDLCGGALPEGRGYKNYPLLKADYGSLTSEQLRALAEKYDAGYAVVPSSSQTEFETLYENDEYKVVRLREMMSVGSTTSHTTLRSSCGFGS